MESTVIELHVGLNGDDKSALKFTFDPGLWQDCGWSVKDTENDGELELFAILLEDKASELLVWLAKLPCVLRAELNYGYNGDDDYTSTLTITPGLGVSLVSVVAKVKIAVATVYDEMVDGFDVTYSEGYVSALEESLRCSPRPPLAVDSVVTSARGREREPSHWVPKPPMAAFR